VSGSNKNERPKSIDFLSGYWTKVIRSYYRLGAQNLEHSSFFQKIIEQAKVNLACNGPPSWNFVPI
jgi:hypothetical protein